MSDEEIEELCRTMLNPNICERKGSKVIDEFFEDELGDPEELAMIDDI